MSDMVLQKNLGALIDVKALSTPYSWTAGGASDSITFTGSSIDREGFATGAISRSADIDIFYSAVLGSGQTLSFTTEVDSSPDNSTWTALATEASTVAATGPSGGGTVTGVFRMTPPDANNPANTPGLSLGSAQRYLRLLVVPHLSRTGTDTATIAAIGVFGGFNTLPAPIN